MIWMQRVQRHAAQAMRSPDSERHRICAELAAAAAIRCRDVARRYATPCAIYTFL